MDILRQTGDTCVGLAAALTHCALPPCPDRKKHPSKPNPKDKRPTIKAEVNLVNLFATVRDKNKRIVTDLKQEDFKISKTTTRRRSPSSPKK